MLFPFIDKNREKPLNKKDYDLPPLRRSDESIPKNYIADDGLVNAVNVALLMGQPLLLTGDPGTGKTQLAYRIAWELGLELLKFETKSTSQARDLFYHYDTLGRFHAVQNPCSEGQIQKYNEHVIDGHIIIDAENDELEKSKLEKSELKKSELEKSGLLGTEPQKNKLKIFVKKENYITYNALGLALIYANKYSDVHNMLPDGFKHAGQRRSVVLIDEIDKAPRDFPNDILNEIENMYFRIPELGNSIIELKDRVPGAEKSLHPVIIITSNSEKHLPTPFLRRCAYYNIPFPDNDRMEKIIKRRLKDMPLFLGKGQNKSEHFIADAVEFFFEIRDAHDAGYKPSTAELLLWIAAIREQSNKENPIIDDPKAIESSLSVLVKSEKAYETAIKHYRNGAWKPNRMKKSK